jgi:hypothetical protein
MTRRLAERGHGTMRPALPRTAQHAGGAMSYWVVAA